MRALVIDDSKSIRSILTRILSGVGFEVDEAANGLEALALIKKEKVDLALVDWNMPDMDGCEFIQLVRKSNAHKDMRLIMVTTETAITKVAEALEAGTVGINDAVPATSQCPFGGMKQSGLGRELGSDGLDAYLETKHVSFGGIE